MSGRSGSDERPLLLVLRALGLGDLLTGVPALRGLRRAFPGHRLVLATPAAFAPLAALSGAVEEVLHTRPFALEPLPAGLRPDVAVNLHGRGPASTAALAALSPRRLLAFDTTGGPAWDDDEHEVARWCRLLAAYGVPADPAELDLPAPPEPALVTGALLAHPGAASGARRWPSDRYAALARWAAARGLPVAVTGSAAETDLAGTVARAAGLPGNAVLAGRTSPLQLAATVAAARALVCGDTGVAHLATAYRVPSVVLFGPVPPTRWGPPADRPWHRALWRGEAGEYGDPHAAEADPRLLGISVEEAQTALREVLDCVPRAASPPAGAYPHRVRAEAALPCDPASVRDARRFVQERLTGWGLAGAAETAVLLVSELVTNALLHARTPVKVVLDGDGDGVRVAVVDASPARPARRRHSLQSGTGRGLLLVDQLAATWGVARRPPGKEVWFALAVDADGAEVGEPDLDGFLALDAGLASP